MIDGILNWLNPVQEVEAPSTFPSLDSLPEDVYHYVLDEVFHLSQPEDQLSLFLVSRAWNQRGHEAKLSLQPKTFLPMALKQSFPNVETLDLSRINTIKDESLPCLSAFEDLISLKLKRCREITNDGLEHLQDLHSLQSLNLARCRLIGDTGLVLLSKKLTNLIKLNVKYCYSLTSEAFAEISLLRNLKTLNCSGCCGLRPEALDFIGQITSLQVLKMNHSDSLLSTNINPILQLPGLIHLQMKTLLQQSSRSNEILTGLAGCLPGLRRLDLNLELDVNQTGFAELASLTNLEVLRISGKNLTSKGILKTVVASLTRLKSFWISDSSLSAPLDTLTQLKTLTIKVEEPMGNQDGAEDHSRSISSLQRLRNLSLAGLTTLTGETVSSLTSLIQLQLIHCPRLDSGNLEGFSALESLEILAIVHADRLDDAFCQNLKNLKKLRQLHLTECATLTGSQFGSLPELEILVVQFCNALTDLVFKQINRLKSLKRLEITMCPSLTEDGLAILGNGQLQRLEFLGFSGGQEPRLNDAFFKAKLPRFKVFFRGSINVTIGDPI